MAERTGITIMGMTFSEEAAVKLDSVQTMALGEAERLCAGEQLHPVAQTYVQTTTMVTDSCQRANTFAAIALAKNDVLA